MIKISFQNDSFLLIKSIGLSYLKAEQASTSGLGLHGKKRLKKLGSLINLDTNCIEKEHNHHHHHHHQGTQFSTKVKGCPASNMAFLLTWVYSWTKLPKNSITSPNE